MFNQYLCFVNIKRLQRYASRLGPFQCNVDPKFQQLNSTKYKRNWIEWNQIKHDKLLFCAEIFSLTFWQFREWLHVNLQAYLIFSILCFWALVATVASFVNSAKISQTSLNFYIDTLASAPLVRQQGTLKHTDCKVFWNGPCFLF